jgi:hypothetical protein
MAGDTSPATPGRSASEPSARSASAFRSATAPPVQTTITGRVSFCRNFFCSAMTAVDSALRGRNAAWSLVATSPRRPA